MAWFFPSHFGTSHPLAACWYLAFGIDNIPTNMPTKRQDVSKTACEHLRTFKRTKYLYKIGANINFMNGDGRLRTPADHRCGGPGRIRTCNQTVMSGRISVRFVDFAAFSSAFDRVCFRLVLSFLVRNWCGGHESGNASFVGSDGASYRSKSLTLSKKPPMARNESVALPASVGLLLQACTLYGT